MDEIVNDEIDFNDETEDTETGAFLATAVVFGAGALLGTVAARNWDKAKTAIGNRVADRREKKIEKINEKILDDAAKKAK
jgi:hypothetical protein